MSNKEEELVRTTITIPRKLKEKIAGSKINLNATVRRMLEERTREPETNMTEAVILNERVRRTAPIGWRSIKVIKDWRKANL